MKRRMRFTRILGVLLLFSLPVQVVPPAGATILLQARQDRAKAELERNGKRLLSDARKKYQAGEYWKSAMDLIFIVDFYTDFSRLDEALQLLGASLYEMEMYEASNRVYRYLMQNMPGTALLPEAMLGMQKAYYQRGEYELSLKFYKALESHYATFDGMNESRYYAGQAYYHLRNYTLASNIVGQIEKGSEFYAFGRYTGALADLKKKTFARPSRALLRLLDCM